MEKAKAKSVPSTPHRRKLAALVAFTRCGGENEARSCYARRCTAASMAQSRKHYA